MKKNGDKLVEAISILYEDNDLVAIDKPGGVVVNNASSVSGPTIQDWWSAKISKLSLSENWQALVPSDFNNEYGTPEEVFAQRSGVVHRLDKDTSGVLLLAKNPGALINLLAQFKQRQVHKTYLCLV
ncbi:MAG TPA: pseudouridine synthase, partial [Candidatus Woesebacteria bacterium]|nr:pseudouridine synthase [Candidatus Woesebacteria bacterium]